MDRTHEVAYKLKFSLRVGSVGGGAGGSSGWVSMKVQKTVNKQVRCCSSNFPGEKNHVWLVLRIFGSRHVNQVQQRAQGVRPNNYIEFFVFSHLMAARD